MVKKEVCIRFQVLTAAYMKMIVLQGVAPCSSVENLQSGMSASTNQSTWRLNQKERHGLWKFTDVLDVLIVIFRALRFPSSS
jgi:hypothetical protein